jgi:hypothetical protein
MRGIRTAGAGIGLALATAAGYAQEAGPVPAAKFGRIRPVEQQVIEPAGGVVVRGQANDASRPPSVMPSVPVGTPQAGPGASLQMPRPLPAPSVDELRGQPGAPLAPPAGYGAPVAIGQPIPVGPPVVVGQPYADPVAPPSVLPGDPFACPVPELDAPIYGGVFGPLGLLTGPTRWQLHADFLMWWISSPRVPPLVTTSSPQYSGILGLGDARALVVDRFLNTTLHTGGRFGGVYWFGCHQRWGFDGNVWFLGRRGKEITIDSGPTGVLARPFFNVNQGIPFSEVVASPGLAVGTVLITHDTQLWGAEANARRYIASTPCARLDLLAGFRYVTLTEELTISERFARVPGSPTTIGVPNVLSGVVTDRIRTENHFYGAQAGLAGEVRRGRWFAEARSTVALGQVVQEVRIHGAQMLQFDNGMGTFPGGLLALPGANIGVVRQEKFAVVPEVGVKVGLHLTPHLRFAFGYNFIYLSSVLRAGDQIDTGLDVTRIPNFPVPGNIQPLPTIRPTVPLRDTGVFAQGISFSLQYNW